MSERDLEWENLVYLWRHLPFRSKIKLMAVGIRYHVAVELVNLSRFRWALLIEGIVMLALVLLAAKLDSPFSHVAYIAIGVIIGGTAIFWVFKDIPRE